MDGEKQNIAALIAGLDDPDKSKIRAAVDALLASSVDEPGLRTKLEQSLGTRQHANPWAFAYVLAKLPQPSATAIRILLESLDHREPDIRWAIALLLTRLARTEGAIAGLLLELSRRGTVNQRRMAVYCIRDLALRDEASLQALLAATGDVEPTIRVAAVTSMKTRSDGGAAARGRLLELFLADGDVRVRNAAAITLAQLGSDSEDFMAALRAAENSADASLKKAVSAALGLLESKRPASGGGSRSR
jgi:HEAT repeat protein